MTSLIPSLDSPWQFHLMYTRSMRSRASLRLPARERGQAKDIIKDVGIVVGSKLTKAIERISRETIVAINQRIGFRLLTKFSEKGVSDPRTPLLSERR